MDGELGGGLGGGGGGGVEHGCQITIAGFLDRMCLALRASGLWLRYTRLQSLIPSFPRIAPPALHPGTIQGKEWIKFCHLAILAVKGRGHFAALAGEGGGNGWRIPKKKKNGRTDRKARIRGHPVQKLEP